MNSKWQLSRVGLVDFWYYDEEDPIPSVAEKNTDAKEKDTIDHISEEILGFFKDEDK